MNDPETIAARVAVPALKAEILAHIAAALGAARALPPSRETSLLLTKLDEARLWAREVVAR